MTQKPIDFSEKLEEKLEDRDENSHRELDPSIFHASQIGYCHRQAYLSKLGLKKHNPETLGIFKLGTLIHEFIEQELGPELPGVFEESFELELDNSIKFVGRADYQYGKTIYDFKTRGGWYKHDPPVERHLDQVHVYMRAFEKPRAVIPYISKKNLEIRPYPEEGYIEYEKDRFEKLKKKAANIRDVILTQGLPNTKEEIPFEKCGCYICENENLKEEPFNYGNG